MKDEASILAEALKLNTEGECQAYLDAACGADAELRAEMEGLLHVHAKVGSFLTKPPSIFDLPRSAEAVNLSAGDYPSVLRLLGEHLDRVPRVAVRDPEAEGGGPVVRPGSDEVPDNRSQGRYELQGEIARGGMGAILRARDRELGRELAIKVLLDSHTDKPEVQRRFLEEAQISGQLQHPGIAPVYELGHLADHRPFFSMKLVKGRTLSALLSERACPSHDRAKFVGIFEQVCQTMAYTHSRGVIHRDLKPANIMVGAFGEVQVMDWGLAKVLTEGGVADEQKSQQKHMAKSIVQTLRCAGGDTPGGIGSETKFGSVMGTPAYMPPEQALGEVDQLDRRCDVFGLGAILCEVLTGQPPYVADDGPGVYRLAIRGKLQDCYDRLRTCGADQELIQLATDCLQPEPDDRPLDAGVLTERIQGYLESIEVRLRETEIARAAEAARAVELRKRQRVMLALAASVLMLVSVGAGSWAWIAHQQAAYREQQAHHREVTTARLLNALNEARLHRQLSRTDDLATRLQELEKALVSAALADDLAREEVISTDHRAHAKDLLTDLMSQREFVEQRLNQVAADRGFGRKLELIRAVQTDERPPPGAPADAEEYLLAEEMMPTVDAVRGEYSDDAPGASGVDESYKTDGREQFAVLSADQRYAEAFRTAGLDLKSLTVDEAARLIRDSTIRDDIIAAIDDWARLLEPGPEEAPLFEVRHEWPAAIWLHRRRIANRPNNARNWLNLAPVILLVEGRESYEKFCRQMLEQFGETTDLSQAGCVWKACLIVPDVVPLERLPLRERAASLAPSAASRSQPEILEYRSGDYDRVLRRIEHFHSLPDARPQAYELALQALIFFRQNNVPAAGAKLSEAKQVLDRVLGRDRSRSPLSNHTTIARILVAEAEAVLGGDPQQDYLRELRAECQQPNLSEPLPAAMERFRLYGKLLDVADAADPNDVRRSLRRAVRRGDVRTLLELASARDPERQSPELCAWQAARLRDSGHADEAIDLLLRVQQLHPADFGVNYELGRSLIEVGRFDRAISYLRAATARRPRSLPANWSLATALQKQGDTPAAAGTLRHLQRVDSTDARIPFALGTYFAQTGDLDAAVAEFREAVAIDPEDRDYSFRLWDSLARQRRYAEALQVCRDSAKHFPESAWHCGWIGWLLDCSGQSAEAIPWYHKAIALDPTRAIVRGNLAAILWRQGRQSESLELVRAGVAADPDNRELRLLAVDYLLKADMSGEACDLLKASPPSGPQQIGRVEQFLTALHKDGRRGHFRVLLETLLTAAPQDGTLQRSLGTLLMMDGRFEEAATRLEQAVHLRPQETWAYLELARAYQGLGRLMEAIARLDEALRIDPGLEEAFSRRSYYHRLLGVHDQSLADARRAITLAPQDWGGYWVLRMACLENGDLDGAIGAMREAVAAIPERPESHFWLAADLAAKGLPQAAEQAFRAAIAAAPEDPHYRFRLAQALTHSGVNEATAITQAIDAAPMTLDSCRRLANLCQISEQPQWGVSVAKSCADAFPDDADAHNLWGWKLYQSTRLAEAVSAFERAIELQPLHADAYEGLGLALNGQREWERSAAAWLRAYELDLTRIRCLRRLVETIRLQGNTDQSWTMLLRGSPQAAGWRHEYAQLLVALGTAEDAAIVRSIEFAPLTSDGYGGLANLCGESGKLSWALTVAKAHVDAYPDHGAAYNGWGYYLIRNQRHAEAIPVLERAIELSPDLAFAYRDLGTAVRHEGELDRAASAFRRSFELDPRRTESLRDLIEVLARPSRVEELKETIQWAVEHSPGNADVPGTIARTLIVRRGDVGPEFSSLAIASAKAACEADPTNGLRWGLLGAAQLRDGQWPAAIESFTRAEELGPSSPYNWLPLAICCWKSDQRPLARTWLQKTIDAQSAHQADPLAGDPFLVDLLSEATELIVPDDPR